MKRIITGEFRKTITFMPLVHFYIGVVCALMGIGVAWTLLAQKYYDPTKPMLNAPEHVVQSMFGYMPICFIVLAMILWLQETQYGGLDQTMLAAANRKKVFVAKFVVALISSVALIAIVFLESVAIRGITLHRMDLNMSVEVASKYALYWLVVAVLAWSMAAIMTPLVSATVLIVYVLALSQVLLTAFPKVFAYAFDVVGSTLITSASSRTSMENMGYLMLWCLSCITIAWMYFTKIADK